MKNQAWEQIYASGQQLNRYPYSEVVSFFFRHRSGLPTAGAKALDVGCGSGVHSDFLAKNGLQVLGFDFSESAVRSARESYPNPSLTFEVGDFDSFEPGDRSFDLVIDRCATTHSTVPTTLSLYNRLRSQLRPGARLFWQGFAWDNSGRELGHDNGDGSWSRFSGGVFERLGRTAFFTEADIERGFDGYEIHALRHVSDRYQNSGYNHSSWIVEAEFNGTV